MRIKKGFTLAEVLIVLMVIGVIAMMTLPSMMRGVTEAQTKTAYKKAFNTISGLYSTLRIEGQVPVVADDEDKALAQKINFVVGLAKNMSVKNYIQKSVNDGAVALREDFRFDIQYQVNGQNQTISGDDFVADTGIDMTNYEFPVATNSADEIENAIWFTTEDNLSYAILANTGARCRNVTTINNQQDTENAIINSCAVVAVDVNGLNKGPNILEIQDGADNQLDTAGADVDMSPLTGDQYYIYVGTNGVTGGNQNATVTGRITADLK